MRIARNIVEFRVGEDVFRATFHHQHGKEATDQYPKRVAGPNGKDYYVSRVLEPLIIDGKDRQGRPCKTELRHITACRLTKREKVGIGWLDMGEGYSFCSINDNYDWRKGIKRSLVAALEDGGFAIGEMLHSFCTELRKRPGEAA